MTADRLLRTAHNWAGLGLSLVLAVLALSGTLLLWKREWLRLVQPGAAAGASVDAAGFGRAAEAAEAAFGPGAVRSMTFADPSFGLHETALRSRGGAYLSPEGAVVDRWDHGERLVDVLFDLHHHLLAGETGTLVSGWVGVAGAVLVLTGVYLWSPARRLFAARLVPRSWKRSDLLAVHRDLGVLTAPVVLVSLLTGAAVALPEQSKPLLRGLAGETAPAPVTAKGGAGDVDWVAAVTAAQARFPGATPRIVVWPAGGKPALVRLRQPGEWHANGRTQVYVSPQGRILAVVDAQAQGRAERLFNGFWPVHASKVGGLAWKLVQFAAGLGLTAISLYGAESYRRRLFPGRARLG